MLQQLNSNQYRNRGRGSSLHLPWVRLLQGLQMSDTFSSPFHGWRGSQAQQQSSILSRCFSGNLMGEDGCSQHKESRANIFRGYGLFFPPQREPRLSPKHVVCFEMCCAVSLMIRADSK